MGEEQKPKLYDLKYKDYNDKDKKEKEKELYSQYNKMIHDKIISDFIDSSFNHELVRICDNKLEIYWSDCTFTKVRIEDDDIEKAILYCYIERLSSFRFDPFEHPNMSDTIKKIADGFKK